MNRRIWSALFFSAMVSACNNVGNNDQYLPGKFPGRIIMNWESQNSCNVTWWTNVSTVEQKAQLIESDASSNIVEKAASYEPQSETAMVSDVEARFHKIRFENLKPSTTYAYRVGDEDAWSEWFQFKTPDEDSGRFSFIYLGDAQNDMRSLWARTIRESYAAQPDASFILHAGDMVDYSQNNYEWGEWFYAAGWIFASVPQVLVAGNHEYVRSNGKGDSSELNPFWRKAFTLPDNGPEGLDELVYYFDFKNVRFIVLDSRNMLISDKNSQLQANWLEGLLKNNPQQWTIISHHHPIYSARSNRTDYIIKDYLEPLYDQYKVDLVLQGHHHSFARGRKPEEVNLPKHTGPVYYVSNSGPKMYDTNFAPWMERVATNVQLYHLVDVNGNKITVDTYLVNGELYDRIVLTKNDDGSKQLEEIRVADVKERLDFSSATYGADIDSSEKNRKTYREKSQEYLRKRNK